MGFNERVIAQRQKMSLSQSDVADALGYTPQGVSRFKVSGSSLPISVLPYLANTLHCSIDFLFGEETPRPDTPYSQSI